MLSALCNLNKLGSPKISDLLNSTWRIFLLSNIVNINLNPILFHGKRGMVNRLGIIVAIYTRRTILWLSDWFPLHQTLTKKSILNGKSLLPKSWGLVGRGEGGGCGRITFLLDHTSAQKGGRNNCAEVYPFTIRNIFTNYPTFKH